MRARSSMFTGIVVVVCGREANRYSLFLSSLSRSRRCTSSSRRSSLIFRLDLSSCRLSIRSCLGGSRRPLRIGERDRERDLLLSASRYRSVLSLSLPRSMSRLVSLSKFLLSLSLSSSFLLSCKPSSLSLSFSLSRSTSVLGHDGGVGNDDGVLCNLFHSGDKVDMLDNSRLPLNKLLPGKPGNPTLYGDGRAKGETLAICAGFKKLLWCVGPESKGGLAEPMRVPRRAC